MIVSKFPKTIKCHNSEFPTTTTAEREGESKRELKLRRRMGNVRDRMFVVACDKVLPCVKF